MKKAKDYGDSTENNCTRSYKTIKFTVQHTEKKGWIQRQRAVLLWKVLCFLHLLLPHHLLPFPSSYLFSLSFPCFTSYRVQDTFTRNDSVHIKGTRRGFYQLNILCHQVYLKRSRQRSYSTLLIIQGAHKV